MTNKALSYSRGPRDTPLIGTPIGELLDEIIGRYPDNDALVSVHQGLRYTYREFGEAVDRCARALLALGLEAGDRVGIWSPNYAEWTILQFATAKVGVVLVNINPSYRLHELKYALESSGCSALVVAEQFKSSDYPAMVQKLVPELDNTDRRIRSEALPRLRSVICLGNAPASSIWTWREFLDQANALSNEDFARATRGRQPDEPINIQYTSGTTGQPKGATLSHRNILNNAHFAAELLGFTEQDRLVIPVPLYHCFGMVLGNLACVTRGATMILPSDSFEPSAVLEAVERERATALHGVPTMFIAELDHPDFGRYDLSSLRTGIMAGSPCPIEVMRAVISRMNLSEMQIAYGMTETSPVSTQTRADAPLEKRVSTVGQVHPHVEIKIIDTESGETVERGRPGELCTRGYSVMLGYWNDPKRTAEAVDSRGWMHTGDLADMDGQGYVRIVGRIKDMVIRGGENIYPREIEEFLYTHPQVRDVQVIGVPDSRYGEELMAWIVLREGAAVSEEDIRLFCRDQIAHFKVPRYIKFVTEFPMTVTGKVQKFVMRNQSIEELGLDGAPEPGGKPA